MKTNRFTFAASVATAFLLGAFVLPALAGVRAERAAGEAWRAEGEGKERRGRHGHHGKGGPGGPLGALLPPQLGKAMFPFWKNENLSEGLNLSAEQVASLEESHRVMKEALDAGKGSAKETVKALLDEVKKEEPNLDSANGLVDELSADLAEKAKIVLGHVVTVKAILTDEQEATLKANAPEAVHGRMEDLRGMREEIREILTGGGSIDDVKALLVEREVPEELQEVIIQRVEEKIAEHMGGKAE
jgi:Spy/CpxP family protein refolding chaperone